MLPALVPLFLPLVVVAAAAGDDAPLAPWPGTAQSAATNGPRPRDEVSATVAAAATALAACAAPNARGDDEWLSVAFTIYPAGVVDLVHVEERSGARAARILNEPCVARTLRGLSFPPRDDAARTTARVLVAATANGADPIGPKLLRGEVSAVVESAHKDMQACYDAARVSDPALEGTVVARLTVDGKGAVKKVDVARGTLPSNDARGCLLDVLSTLHFPPPRGGGPVNVEYPIVFAGAQDAHGTPAADASTRVDKQKPWERARNLFECFGCGSTFSTKNLVPR